MRKALAAALFLVFATANAQQWELTTAIKSRGKFPAVQMMNATLGYALDDNAVPAILRTRDGGHSWERMNQLSVNTPNAMHMWDEQRGIVVGGSGSIYRSTDGFESYTSNGTGAYGTLRSVMFANDTLGLIGTDAGRIYRSTDGGASWTLTTSGISSSYSITGIAMPSVNTAYACAYGVGVMRSTDGGLTWQPTAAAVPTGSRTLHFSDALTGVVVGNSGNIHRTNDGGVTWVQASSGITQNILALTVQGNVMLASGTSGNILRSANAGATWTVITVGTGTTTHQSISLSPEGVGIIGTDGRINGTVDFGATWQLLRLGTYHTVLNKVSFQNDLVGVAVGSLTAGGAESGLLRTTDGGRNWSNAGSGGLGVHLLPSGVGCLGGGSGSFARTTDAFTTRIAANGPNVAIRCTWSFDANTHIVAGGAVYGGIYRSTNSGSTWTHVLDVGNITISDLWFVNNLQGYAVGEYGDDYRTMDGGLTWQEMTGTSGGHTIFFLNDTLGWTRNFRTTDGGDTWIQMGGTSLSTRSIFFTDPDTGYAVSFGGQTERSTDGGINWSPILPNIVNAQIGDATIVDGVIIAVGRWGDIYRARVACPSIATIPLITSSGETLCTSTTGNAQWYHNGDPLPVGNTPCIEAMEEGAYTVVMTDALGCVSGTSAPFQVIHTGVASMESGTTRLVPNPASDRVRIERLDNSPARLTLSDVQGRIVRQEVLSGTSNTVDVSGLKAGVYLVRIATANEVETLRLVKE
ncbi:MAG: T9SS type A sorting domain-containing protein [Flavobacteriales bacterium]